MTGRLITQFSAYQAAPGVTVNGRLTLGENIADLGGLNVAHDALQAASDGKADHKIDGLTRDQRFFVGWATAWRGRYTPERENVIIASDPHAPDRFRANGAASNVPAFATAFDCNAGDAMAHRGHNLISIW